MIRLISKIINTSVRKAKILFIRSLGTNFRENLSGAPYITFMAFMAAWSQLIISRVLCVLYISCSCLVLMKSMQSLYNKYTPTQWSWTGYVGFMVHGWFHVSCNAKNWICGDCLVIVWPVLCQCVRKVKVDSSPVFNYNHFMFRMIFLNGLLYTNCGFCYDCKVLSLAIFISNCEWWLGVCGNIKVVRVNIYSRIVSIHLKFATHKAHVVKSIV